MKRDNLEYVIKFREYFCQFGDFFSLDVIIFRIENLYVIGG